MTAVFSALFQGALWEQDHRDRQGAVRRAGVPAAAVSRNFVTVCVSGTGRRLFPANFEPCSAEFFFLTLHIPKGEKKKSELLTPHLRHLFWVEGEPGVG